MFPSTLLLKVWFKSTTMSFHSPPMLISVGVDHEPLTSCLPPCKQLYRTSGIVTVPNTTNLNVKHYMGLLKKKEKACYRRGKWATGVPEKATR
jgi:hypothetical protein